MEKKYRLFDSSREYTDFVGDVRFIIVSDCAEQELLEAYTELQTLRPFVLCTNALWHEISSVFHESSNNDAKHRMRCVRRHDLFGYVDGETELGLSAIARNAVLDEVIRNFENELLYKALNRLTETQRRRTRLYYILQMTLEEIAEMEGVSVQSVYESIKAAIKRLNFLLQTP